MFCVWVLGGGDKQQQLLWQTCTGLVVALMQGAGPPSVAFLKILPCDLLMVIAEAAHRFFGKQQVQHVCRQGASMRWPA